MAQRELKELAREVGGDELAERVERLEEEIAEVSEEIQQEREEADELQADLVEKTDLSEEAVEGMELQALREVAEAEGIRDRTNERVNVAGHPEMIPDDTPDVTVNRSPETYEKEVPLEGGDDPATMTVEYQERGPTIEAINQYHGWLNQSRSEETRRANERANEEKISGGIPSMEYMNSDEMEDVEDSQIPVAGQVDTEEDDE